VGLGVSSLSPMCTVNCTHRVSGSYPDSRALASEGSVRLSSPIQQIAETDVKQHWFQAIRDLVDDAPCLFKSETIEYKQQSSESLKMSRG